MRPPTLKDNHSMAYALERARIEFGYGLPASFGEMNLVKDAYPESDEETSSSESDTSGEPAPPTEKSTATAIPSHLAEQYSAKRKRAPVDDPELHEGRHRRDRGKRHGYGTHVHLEWTPNRLEYEALDKIIATMRWYLRGSDVVLTPRYLSDTHIQLPLHISLSQAALLEKDQRWDFIKMVRNKVARASRVKPFSVKLGVAYWWTCHESDQHWLCLAIDKPEGDELNKLYAAMDDVSMAFDLPRLYPSGVKSTDESSNATDATGTCSDATGRPQQNSNHQNHGSGLGDKTDRFHITIATTNRRLTWRERRVLARRAGNLVMTAVQNKGVLFNSVTCKVGTATEKLMLRTGESRTRFEKKNDASGPTGNASAPDKKKQKVESQ